MDRGWRLPAPVLESQLASATVRHLTGRLPSDISPAASTDDLQRVQHRLCRLASSASAEQIQAILNCIKRATISPGKVDLVLCDQATGELLGTRPDWIDPDALTFPTGFQYRKRGVETKLIIGAGPAKTRDDVLIRNIAKAQSYYEAIKQGSTFEDVAKSDGISAHRVMQIIDLAFLAPAIVQLILSGDQPTGLTTKWLAKNALPTDWQKQREIIAAL